MAEDEQDTSEDDGNSYPPANPGRNPHGKHQGGKKRMLSDTGGSGSGSSIKADQESSNAKDMLKKRRRRSGRGSYLMLLSPPSTR